MYFSFVCFVLMPQDHFRRHIHYFMQFHLISLSFISYFCNTKSVTELWFCYPWCSDHVDTVFHEYLFGHGKLDMCKAFEGHAFWHMFTTNLATQVSSSRPANPRNFVNHFTMLGTECNGMFLKLVLKSKYFFALC